MTIANDADKNLCIKEAQMSSKCVNCFRAEKCESDNLHSPPPVNTFGLNKLKSHNEITTNRVSVCTGNKCERCCR